jgi:hypothetical protein
MANYLAKSNSPLLTSTQNTRSIFYKFYHFRFCLDTKARKKSRAA